MPFRKDVMSRVAKPPTRPLTPFGRRIKLLDLSLVEAGRMFGCHHSTVSRLMLGRCRPSRLLAARICQALGEETGITVDIKELWDGRLQDRKKDSTVGGRNG